MDSDPSSLTGPELYVVVRKAVADAIWDVIGGVVTVLFGGLLVYAGLLMAASGFGSTSTGGLLLGLFGLVLAFGAAAVLAREFDVRPFDG